MSSLLLFVAVVVAAVTVVDPSCSHRNVRSRTCSCTYDCSCSYRSCCSSSCCCCGYCCCVSVSRFGKRGTVVDGMSDQPFSTTAEARRNRRHASWMLSLLLVPDKSSSSCSSSSAARGAVTDGGCEDAASVAGRRVNRSVSYRRQDTQGGVACLSCVDCEIV